MFRIPIPRKNQSSFTGIETVPLGTNAPPLYKSIFDFLFRFSIVENLYKVIEVDTSNFTIFINYHVDTNTIVAGYLLVKENFRVSTDGFIHALGNNLTLNGSFLTYTIGNTRGKYFYYPHKISVKNGNIVSNVSGFSIFTTRVFYE